MKHILIVFSLLLFLADFTAAVAEKNAGEGYAIPTHKELTQTIVLLRGLDINDPKVADEYARLTRCQLYKQHYKNDIAWNKIRMAVVSDTLEKKEYPRILYETSGVFQLDRYDFEGQYFPLSRKTAMTNVGTIVLLSSQEFQPYCGINQPPPQFPANVNLVLNQALTLNKFRVPAEKVEKILARMEEMGNPERYVYGRLRFRVIDVPGLVTVNDSIVRAELLGHVTAIDFFLDEKMTKQIGDTQLQKAER